MLTVEQAGMIEVFSCGSTCRKDDRCIPRLLECCGGTTYIQKVVVADLSHKENYMWVHTCPEGGKDRPSRSYRCVACGSTYFKGGRGRRV